MPFCVYRYSQRMISSSRPLWATLALSVSLFAPAAVSAADVSIVDVPALLKEWKVTMGKNAEINAVSASNDGTKVAVAIDDPKGLYIYLNGKKVVSQAWGYLQVGVVTPPLLSFTPDNHLISIFGGPAYGFAIDDKTVSNDPTSSYYWVPNIVAITGAVIYPESTTIKKYDFATKKSTVLYKVGEYPQMVRLQGKDVYYSAGAAIYKNGKAVSTYPVSDTYNWLPSSAGDLYYFTSLRGGSSYALMKNNKAMLSGKGNGSFLFEAPNGDIWHAGYNWGSYGTEVTLYRNKTKVNDKPFANMEGWMTFDGTHYAVRVDANVNEPGELRLMKDGILVGEPFFFGDATNDRSGVQFGPQGKTYMRNNNDLFTFALYEDGTPILTQQLETVYYFHATKDGVKVYAKKK